MPRTFLAASLLFVAGGCSQQSEPDADLAKLIAADTALNEAVAAKDGVGVARFYAADAVYMPTAEPLIRGSAAITDEWKHTVAIPGFVNTTKRMGAEVSGRLGYTWGIYQSRLELKNGSTATEPGKWLTIWRKNDNGRWLIVVDTYNTDIMPPDHK